MKSALVPKAEAALRRAWPPDRANPHQHGDDAGGGRGGNFGDGVAVRNNTLVAGAFAQHPPVEGYPGGEAYAYRLEGE
jgi:hypothetical protein